MSAARYTPAIERLNVGPRWWRTGDRTIAQLEREQRREAQARQTYQADELRVAMQRLIDGTVHPIDHGVPFALLKGQTPRLELVRADA